MSSSHYCRVSSPSYRRCRSPNSSADLQYALPCADRSPARSMVLTQFGISSPPLIGLYHIDIFSYVFLSPFDLNPRSPFQAFHFRHRLHTQRLAFRILLLIDHDTVRPVAGGTITSSTCVSRTCIDLPCLASARAGRGNLCESIPQLFPFFPFPCHHRLSPSLHLL